MNTKFLLAKGAKCGVGKAVYEILRILIFRKSGNIREKLCTKFEFNLMKRVDWNILRILKYKFDFIMQTYEPFFPLIHGGRTGILSTCPS